MSENIAGNRLLAAWRDWAANLSFQTKLTLVVNLLIVLLILGAALVGERRQRTAIVQEVEKRALLMAQALDSATAADLTTYNYVSIEQTVLKFGNKPDLVYAAVLDKEGDVAAQFIQDYPLRQIVNQRGGEKASRRPIIDQVQVPGTTQETVYDVTWPVMIADSREPWGTIRLGVSLKAMHKEIARTRWQIAGFGVLGLLLASAGATLLARRITRPIQALTVGVGAVGRGDFSQRIEVTSRDELGQLSAAFNDMTAQLARVRDLEERLRRADRLAALGTMAAGIAHDIRNPLTSIGIFSQLMCLHHDDPDVRQKFERVVPRELERIQAVIEDMMELVRPPALQFEPTSLNEVLSQVLELYEGQSAAQAIKTTRDLDPDLPPCLADKRRLHRCFGNLVANAIQAMPSGGDLAVRTRLVSDGALSNEMPDVAASGALPRLALRVEITDTGQGIPPDHLPRVFDPFYTTKEKGVGLGMAIAHRIVEDHKGTIDVQSQVGLGTTFTIHLPVKP